MLIQCTKKLLDQLNIKADRSGREKPFFSWHANLIRINRRKTVVLMNDKNRYIVILYGLKADNFENMNKHIYQAIKNTFQKECIKDSIIEQYIGNTNEIIYNKTKNRSLVAQLNQTCRIAQKQEKLLDDNSIYQTVLSQKASKEPVNDSDGNFFYPRRKMYKDLETISGETVFGCKAAKIKITLELDNNQVWRRFKVPVNITFNNLHKLIQTAFAWKNYHLYEFIIYDSSETRKLSPNRIIYHKENFKPILELVHFQEDLEYANKDIEMKLDQGKKLEKYLDHKIKYVYDFGDFWEHYLEIEEIIDDYDKNYPVCLKGKGDTPPEDVGGVSGYKKFLKIINDGNHPQHQHMVDWSEYQGYEKFDIKKLNKNLKNKFQ